MNHSLSVLIPVFNCSCHDLVTALHELLCKEAIQWEIIVADDGSDDEQMKAENRAICSLENVRLIEREVNSGRAKIRNFLASEAQYDRLLFLDGDNSLRNDKFISNYLAHETPVVYGGYDIIHDDSSLHSNLRYRYELKAEGNHSVAIRQQRPYQNFNTKNFLVNKEVMTRFPFDERFRHYGYEDVLWGKTLCDNGIAIKHINNPVTATDFETNSDQTVDGEEITISENSGITREALEDGYYIMSARISDQRGDTYYAPVVGATVSGGKIVEWKLDPAFYGNPY